MTASAGQSFTRSDDFVFTQGLSGVWTQEPHAKIPAASTPSPPPALSSDDAQPEAQQDAEQDAQQEAAAEATASVFSSLLSCVFSRSERQNCSAQESIFPMSYAALSLTRSFHVPLATSDEAFTVYVVMRLSLLPPVP